MCDEQRSVFGAFVEGITLCHKVPYEVRNGRGLNGEIETSIIERMIGWIERRKSEYRRLLFIVPPKTASFLRDLSMPVLVQNQRTFNLPYTGRMAFTVACQESAPPG